jgi:hypothetical protein
VFFFFKRKKIVVDCFTANHNAANLFPIDKSNKFYPDWWKKIPLKKEAIAKNGVKFDTHTIRACSGFIDLYSKSITIPLWSDLIIETNSFNINWYFYDLDSSITNHPKSQYTSTDDEKLNFLHAKIISPWRFQEKTGVSFVFMEPFWNNRDCLGNYFTPPGVVEYKYNHSTEINILFPNKVSRIEMKAGSPMAHIIPLSDHEVIIKNHLITEEEFKFKFNVRRWTSKFRYLKEKNILSKKEKKCPFGFGK